MLPVAEPPSPQLVDDPDQQDNSPPTVDSSPPPQMQASQTVQTQQPSSPQPQSTTPSHIENQDTQYTTRSGRTCKPNPKYMWKKKEEEKKKEQSHLSSEFNIGTFDVLKLSKCLVGYEEA